MRDLKNPKKGKKKKPLNRKRSIIITIIVLCVVLTAGGFGIAAIVNANEYVATANFYVKSDGTIATGQRDGTEKLHQTKIYKSDYQYELITLRDQSEQQAMQQNQQQSTDPTQAQSQTPAAMTVDQRRSFWTSPNNSTGTTGEHDVKVQALNYCWQTELLVFMANQKDKYAFSNAIETAKTSVEKEYMDQKITKEAFKKNLKDKYGISYSSYVEIKAKSSLVSTFANNEISAMTYTDDELNAYYQQNKDSIDKYTFKYAIYLTQDTTSGQALTDEQAQQKKDKADAALEKLKKGYDFDKLIQDESDAQPQSQTNSTGGTDSTAGTDTGKKQDTLELTMKDILGDQSLSDLAGLVQSNDTTDYKLIDVTGTGYVIVKYISSTMFANFDDTAKANAIKTFQQQKYGDYIKAIQNLDVNPIVEHKAGKIIDDIDIINI